MPASVQADEIEGWSERVEVGGHLGLSFATLGGEERNDSGVDYSYRTGGAGGGAFTMRLTRFFSEQLEINFITKGFRGETSFPSTSGTQYMAYLEIPILVQVGVPVSERLTPFLIVGPAIGVLLDADIRFDDGRFDERDGGIERFDIGMLFGGGVAVDMGKIGSMIFESRYNLGLRDWISNPSNEALNRAIYLTVGYRADLATLGRLFGGQSR